MEAVAAAAAAAAAAAVAAAAVAAAAVDGPASSHSCLGSLPFPAPFQADRSSPKCFRPRQSQAAFDRWLVAATAFAAAAGPFEKVLPSSGHASEEAAVVEVDRPVQEHPAADPESVHRGTCNDTIKINTNCHNN